MTKEKLLADLRERMLHHEVENDVAIVKLTASDLCNLLKMADETIAFSEVVREEREAWSLRGGGGMCDFDGPWLTALRDGKTGAEATKLGAYALLDAFSARLVERVTGSDGGERDARGVRYQGERVVMVPKPSWLRKHEHQSSDVMTALLRFHDGECAHIWVEDGVCDLCDAEVGGVSE